MSQIENYSIPYNKPFLIGTELQLIAEAVKLGKLSGNGHFTKLCHNYFSSKYHFQKVLLTTSCTDALEMAAILSNIGLSDEVIMPSYTFVSTANAFVLRGATVKFADCRADYPNMDYSEVVKLISPKTKAIVLVHYAGVAHDLERYCELCKKRGIILIEDAAHAIDSFHRGKILGSFGQFATFSFHETKNISCGEGGLLVINEESYNRRAEIIWEKGTDRAAFFRGEIDKYGWVDIGSSFLPSELNAAFLYSQLSNLEIIQSKRRELWNYYHQELTKLAQTGWISLPPINDSSCGNGHLFYIQCRTLVEREALKKYLNGKRIGAISHYSPLHQSKFLALRSRQPSLPNTERFADTILRLPMYYELEKSQVDYIVKNIEVFFSTVWSL